MIYDFIIVGGGSAGFTGTIDFFGLAGASDFTGLPGFFKLTVSALENVRRCSCRCNCARFTKVFCETGLAWLPVGGGAFGSEFPGNRAMIFSPLL